MDLRVRELFQAHNMYSSNLEGDLNSFERINDVNKLVLFPVEGHGQMVFILS
jgi:hypothetical protein